ncbi:MAG: tetratricopeptide repeat protein [Verrucomicrobiales bacterium]|nr:tetratricopeptide repeat protein [Verrucomicrobiales bacterium]
MAKKHKPHSKKAPEGDPVTEGRSAEEALAESHASEAIAALEENKVRILVVVLALAVGLCVYLVWKQVVQSNHEEASQAYFSAVASGKVEELDKVAGMYSGSIVAGNALLAKADLQIDQGKPGDAKTTLLSFVDSKKNHPRYPQGLLVLGMLNLEAGDTAAAKQYFEQILAATEDGDLSPLARIRLGDAALADGDQEAARQHYEDSYIQHPGNPFVPMAEQKIELLSVGEPPVVKAPEPEPEPVPFPEKGAKGEAPKAAPPAKAEKGKAEPKGNPDKGKAKSGDGNGKGKGKSKSPAKAPQSDKGKGKAKGPDKG